MGRVKSELAWDDIEARKAGDEFRGLLLDELRKSGRGSPYSADEYRLATEAVVRGERA